VLLVDRLAVGAEQELLLGRGDLGERLGARGACRVDREEAELVVVPVGDDGDVARAPADAQPVGDVDVVVAARDAVGPGSDCSSSASTS
jgi:hypothetical protein